MTVHPCEHEDDGVMCGAPACVRLTGEKVLCKPWVMLVCDDHRHIAGFVMELRDYTSRKETFLLDTAEGQIANLEDALLDAVRCFIGDQEPKEGNAEQWLETLLDGMSQELIDYIRRDHQFKQAYTGAQSFLNALDEERHEEAACSGD